MDDRPPFSAEASAPAPLGALYRIGLPVVLLVYGGLVLVTALSVPWPESKAGVELLAHLTGVVLMRSCCCLGTPLVLTGVAAAGIALATGSRVGPALVRAVFWTLLLLTPVYVVFAFMTHSNHLERVAREKAEAEAEAEMSPRPTPGESAPGR
jgi:hypothetical protein